MLSTMVDTFQWVIIIGGKHIFSVNTIFLFFLSFLLSVLFFLYIFGAHKQLDQIAQAYKPKHGIGDQIYRFLDNGSDHFHKWNYILPKNIEHGRGSGNGGGSRPSIGNHVSHAT